MIIKFNLHHFHLKTLKFIEKIKKFFNNHKKVSNLRKAIQKSTAIKAKTKEHAKLIEETSNFTFPKLPNHKTSRKSNIYPTHTHTKKAQLFPFKSNKVKNILTRQIPFITRRITEARKLFSPMIVFHCCCLFVSHCIVYGRMQTRHKFKKEKLITKRKYFWG